MEHILKAIEGEQIRSSIMWDLTIYDDETEKIEERSIIQIMEDEIQEWE